MPMFKIKDDAWITPDPTSIKNRKQWNFFQRYAEKEIKNGNLENVAYRYAMSRYCMYQPHKRFLEEKKASYWPIPHTPVCVRSRNRPDNSTMRKFVARDRTSEFYYFVVADQLEAYEREISKHVPVWPQNVTFVVVPDEHALDLVTTNNFVVDHMWRLGYKRIFILDDDMTEIRDTFVFPREDGMNRLACRHVPICDLNYILLCAMDHLYDKPWFVCGPSMSIGITSYMVDAEKWENKQWFVDTSPTIQYVLLDLEKMKKLGIRYRRNTGKEDYDLILQGYSRGYYSPKCLLVAFSPEGYITGKTSTQDTLYGGKKDRNTLFSEQFLKLWGDRLVNKFPKKWDKGHDNWKINWHEVKRQMKEYGKVVPHLEDKNMKLDLFRKEDD